MFEVCFRIGGHVHCFPIPVLGPPVVIPHGPGPVNYPELELAATVMQMAEAVQHAVPESELTKQLTEVAGRFVDQVRAGLPDGVELRQVSAAAAQG